MLRRLVVAGLMALAIAVVAARPQAAARPSSEAHEVWNDCSELPDGWQFLPYYLGRDTQGFVDVGTDNLQGLGIRAVQYTRDKDFGGVRAVAGRWYGSQMGFARGPAGADLRSQMAAFRLIALEVDGTSYAVDPSCVRFMDDDDYTIGLYNVWVRFSDAGIHTVKIFGRQIAPFPFLDAAVAAGGMDPFGLDGRRVFVGERIGDVMDGQFVHTYELQVGSEETGGGGGG
jgi:hypothetical protein